MCFHGISLAAVHSVKQLQMMSNFLCSDSTLRGPSKTWLRFTWLVCNLFGWWLQFFQPFYAVPCFSALRARCTSEGYFSPASCTVVSPSRWLIRFDEICPSKMEVQQVKAILLSQFTKLFLFLSNMNYCNSSAFWFKQHPYFCNLFHLWFRLFLPEVFPALLQKFSLLQLQSKLLPALWQQMLIVWYIQLCVFHIARLGSSIWQTPANKHKTSTENIHVKKKKS